MDKALPIEEEKGFVIQHPHGIELGDANIASVAELSKYDHATENPIKVVSVEVVPKRVFSVDNS